MTIRKWRGPDGREIDVGDKDDIGALLGISPKTWRNYSLKGAATNPAPKPVTVDPVTRRDLWDLAEVREWQAHRPGRGDHGGAGARKRWGRESS